MTVSSTPSRNQYIATAGQTIFPYAFEIFSAGDLVVEINGITQSEGTNYTILGVGVDTGGSITLTSGATAGDIVTVYRDMELNRLNDYQQSGDFLAEEVNDDFDRLWLAIQQIEDSAGRSIRASTSDTVLNSTNTLIPSVEQRAGRTLGFDTQGVPTYYSAAVPVGDFKVFDNVEAMKADTNLQLNDVALCKRYYSGGELVEGLVYEIQASQTVDGFVDHALVNGNTAKLLCGGCVNATQAGAVGDGVTDDTAPLYALGRYITSGFKVVFEPKEYLISYAGTGQPSYNSVYGEVIFPVSNKKNLVFEGNNCTIKLVNHDIGANGGLSFISGELCQNLTVKGFNFDFSYTASSNTSGSFYPFVGGIVINDPDSTPNNTASMDIYISDCTFKMYHPWGQFATSPNAYLGDPNNGFKSYCITMLGNNTATTFDTQNRNLVIENCTVKKGHNGYGFWAWAFNNVKFINPTAEDYCAWYSNSAGAYVNNGVPFIRYHQFQCTDVLVENISFRAKPSIEKTGGFKGGNPAIGFISSNNSANYTNGLSVVRGGHIVAGNGDLSNAVDDYLIRCTCYGVIKIDGTDFDAHPLDSNSSSGNAIQYTSESGGGTGYGELHISNVNFSPRMDKYQSIQVLNGVSSVASDRRCKFLSVKNVNSLAQLQYGLDLSGNSAATFQGCERVEVDDLLIKGTDNVTFDKNSTNSRTLFMAGVAGDVVRFNDLTIKDKYYSFSTNGLDAGALFIVDGFREEGVTVRYLAPSNIAIKEYVSTGNPEGVEVANVGSRYLRSDGGAGTTLYVKETGSGSTGWVAK